ncbi:hypothetical protein OUZ56_007577 [Daphnia magna]|uniref:Uncharacterized protein n=1 Tax=Daphnia magna TaxID=35525 RepID=A0ABR0AAN5_9CRUS|nr:hypothetical protein OUZ56_007577 [Daphnia magna]
MTTEEFLAEYPPCSCLNRSSNTNSPVDVTPVKWIFTLTLKKGSLEVVRATRQFLPNISLCCVGIGAQTTFPRSLVEVQSARNQ